MYNELARTARTSFEDQLQPDMTIGDPLFFVQFIRFQ